MRFISLQNLPARRYNKTVPKPDDTLRRFLAMTFAADRIVDLAPQSIMSDGFVSEASVTSTGSATHLTKWASRPTSNPS